MTTSETIVAVIPVGSKDAALSLSIEGRPVIDWTIRLWRTAPGIGQLVLAVDGAIEPRASIPIAMGKDRVSAIQAALVTAGMPEAILLCSPDRPLGSASNVEAMRSQLAGFDAVAAARPVRSTLKRVVDGRVVATVPRDEWRSEPDPWLFRRGALVHALELARATGLAIDDGRDLALAGGLRVRFVDADASDFPIRTPADVRFAERWLTSTSGSSG